MRFHAIEEILTANEQAVEKFESAISGLTEAQTAFKPGEDEWSIGEIVEHVGIVSNGFLRITRKLLKGAEAEGRPPKIDLDLRPVSIDDDGNAFPKFKAPEQVLPGGNAAMADVMADLRQTLEGFREVRSRLEAVDLSDQTFPHPAFGPINTYQWMVLLGEHTDRHRNQIERIKASPGFPSLK